MRIFRERGDSLKFGLSFFVILGAIIGSLFCNEMSGEMKKELCAAELDFVNRTALAGLDFRELFLGIIPSRLWQLIILFLITWTSFSSLFLMIAAGYLGFSSAVMISSVTMSSGFWGLWRFLLLIFPQCLLYLPVIYVLFWWMPIERQRLTISKVLILSCMVLAGTFLEAFVNPWILLFF